MNEPAVSPPHDDPAAQLTRARILAFRWRGVAIAALVMLSWGGAQAAGLFLLPARDNGYLWGLPLVVVLSFLNTGLFITAHDGMHGVLAPHDPRLNHALGRLALLLYLGFPYTRFRRAHFRHHLDPASAADPDYHDGRHPGFLRWLTRFFVNYVSWPQLLVMNGIVWGLHLLCGVPFPAILLFWALPAVLSALQLFYFGTYLPHREPRGGYTNRHRATSSNYPELVSLVTCYHFGYHFEHHEHPYSPWWRLPRVRRLRRALS